MAILGIFILLFFIYIVLPAAFAVYRLCFRVSGCSKDGVGVGSGKWVEFEGSNGNGACIPTQSLPLESGRLHRDVMCFFPAFTSSTMFCS